MPALSITEACEASGEFPSVIGGGKSTRIFNIQMDLPTRYPSEVMQALFDFGVTRGSLHPTDGLYAQNFKPTQRGGERRDLWRVEVEYGITPPDEGEDPNAPDIQWRDPLLDPPEISWVTKQREVVVDKDVDGNPILNYAKRPYDPPLTDWLPTCVLRVSRNEPTANFATLGAYLGKVNSTVWLGAAKRHVLCADIQASKQRRSYRAENNAPLITVTYWRVSYEFEFIENDPAPDDEDIGPWDAYIFQADFEQLNSAGDDTEPILDANGEPVRTPWPIGVDGRAIPKDQLPGSAKHRGHKKKKTIDFNQLNIVI